VFRSKFIQSVRRTPALAPFLFDAHLCLAEFSLHSIERCDAIVALARELLTVPEQGGSSKARRWRASWARWKCSPVSWSRQRRT